MTMPTKRSTLWRAASRPRRVALAAVLVAAVIGGLAVAAPRPGATVTVRVLSAKVMATPKFIGKTAAQVSRGQQLQVAETKGDWLRVTGAAAGWIHLTNVTERAVTLSSKPGQDGKGAASRDEVELAGRGFTPQVEEQYRQKNPKLDFSYVDAIEKTEVDLQKLAAFIEAGGLAQGGEP
jgi:hypothetical protein